MYTFIDTHVHLYDDFHLNNFIPGVNQNISNICSEKQVSVQQKVCILTEGFYDRGFDALLSLLKQRDEFHKNTLPPYQLMNTDGRSFIYLDTENGDIIFIAGKQIISSDKLELLLAGTGSIDNPSGKTTEELVRDIAGNGTVVILPWGVGKWLGSRGNKVTALLQNSSLPMFFIGDSANRPVFWPEPEQFGIARENGIRNLPGSDPLPVKNGYKNVGRAGILVKHQINPDDPVTSLQKILLEPSSDIQPYIKRENPMSFFLNQIAMQFKKYHGNDN